MSPNFKGETDQHSETTQNSNYGGIQHQREILQGYIAEIPPYRASVSEQVCINMPHGFSDGFSMSHSRLGQW